MKDKRACEIKPIDRRKMYDKKTNKTHCEIHMLKMSWAAGLMHCAQEAHDAAEDQVNLCFLAGIAIDRWIDR